MMRKLFLFCFLLLCFYSMGQQADNSITFTGTITFRVVAELKMEDAAIEKSRITVQHKDAVYIYSPERSTTHKQVFVMIKNGSFDKSEYFELKYNRNDPPKSKISCIFVHRAGKMRFQLWR